VASLRHTVADYMSRLERLETRGDEPIGGFQFRRGPLARHRRPALRPDRILPGEAQVLIREHGHSTAELEKRALTDGAHLLRVHFVQGNGRGGPRFTDAENAGNWVR
jgi:hypothetical protein